jgi:hypothetical protein
MTMMTAGQDSVLGSGSFPDRVMMHTERMEGLISDVYRADSYHPHIENPFKHLNALESRGQNCRRVTWKIRHVGKSEWLLD